MPFDRAESISNTVDGGWGFGVTAGKRCLTERIQRKAREDAGREDAQPDGVSPAGGVTAGAAMGARGITQSFGIDLSGGPAFPGDGPEASESEASDAGELEAGDGASNLEGSEGESMAGGDTGDLDAGGMDAGGDMDAGEPESGEGAEGEGAEVEGSEHDGGEELEAADGGAPVGSAAAPTVQRRGRRDHDGEAVHAAAARGIGGTGGQLPHRDRIQEAFGRHDVGQVRAHVGGAAATACEAIGAEAYATGDAVAFRDAPDLHTAAHEAAHVVQQRAGVSLKGGLGVSGDIYERHADRVADLVVRGESAETTLGELAGPARGSSVQRRAAQPLQLAAKPKYVAPSSAKAPARTASLASVRAAHALEQALASGRANLGQVEAKAKQMRRLWQATLTSQNQLAKQAQYLEQQVNKADGLIAFNTTLTNWIGTFDTVLSLGEQATSMVTSITGLVQAGKRTKNAVIGAAKQLKSQAPNQQKLVRAVTAVGKQGQKAYHQGQASVKGANQMAGTFANVDGILRNATQAPDGAQAQQELVAMLKELNVKELMKDKAKLKDKLLRLGIKGGAHIQRMAAAKAHAELERRKAAAEAALADVRAAFLHVTRVHRAVNHGLASLEHAVRTFRALR